jgi:hypothetical protein
MILNVDNDQLLNLPREFLAKGSLKGGAPRWLKLSLGR